MGATAFIAPPPTQPLRRGAQQRCRAAANGGSGGSSNDVRARIARAREYSKAAAEQQAAQQATSVQQAAKEQRSPPAAAAAAPPGGQAGVEAAFSEAAQQLAAREEAQFLQAVAEVGSSASSEARPAPAAPAMPSSSSSSGTPSSSQAASEAVLARINAARKYKQQPAADQPDSSGSSSSSSGGGGGSPASAAAPAAEPPQADAEQQRSFRTGGGGAEQAANWLRFAEGSGAAAAQIDQSLSAEQFTLAKEELMKQQDVEIVTVDAAYAAQLRQEKQAQQAAAQAAGGAGTAEASGATQQEGEEGEDLHKPKVATWGVSPAAPPPPPPPPPLLLLPHACATLRDRATVWSALLGTTVEALCRSPFTLGCPVRRHSAALELASWPDPASRPCHCLAGLPPASQHLRGVRRRAQPAAGPGGCSCLPQPSLLGARHQGPALSMWTVKCTRLLAASQLARHHPPCNRMLCNAGPMQALESEEAAAARQARVSAALKEYRKTLGLDVDPAVEADAQVRCPCCACPACVRSVLNACRGPPRRGGSFSVPARRGCPPATPTAAVWGAPLIRAACSFAAGLLRCRGGALRAGAHHCGPAQVRPPPAGNPCCRGRVASPAAGWGAWPLHLAPPTACLLLLSPRQV